VTVTLRAALEQSGLVPVDARALLAHVLERDRAWLIAHAGDALDRAHVDAFFALAKRRRDGEPVAYLVGRREFWGLPFDVSPAVLIPRPETETLVEAALQRLPADRSLRVLDLGTGSGAIAIAIARERPLAQVTATDVSSEALDVARANARRLNADNVAFARADWYEGLRSERYDAIVSNPPYVAPDDPHLREGDLRFEPRLALVPRLDALSALASITGGARQRLADNGCLILEHGHDQADAVVALFEGCGFADVCSLRDLAGIRRVVAGRAAAFYSVDAA
jgi:release factor glutamine methyltransferase